MLKALKDGAAATVNGEVRGFQRADGDSTRTASPPHVTHVVSRRPAPMEPPPLVTVKIAPEVQSLLSAAQRVSHIGEQAVDLLGPVGVAAALGLVAYGGYRWYKNQSTPPRRRQRKIKAALLPGGK